MAANTPQQTDRLRVATIYLVALTLLFLICSVIDSKHLVGWSFPLMGRWIVAMHLAMGPLACLIAELAGPHDLILPLAFIACWTTWIALVVKTRLGDPPYSIHIFAVLLWFLFGIFYPVLLPPN